MGIAFLDSHILKWTVLTIMEGKYFIDTCGIKTSFGDLLLYHTHFTYTQCGMKAAYT